MYGIHKLQSLLSRIERLNKLQNDVKILKPELENEIDGWDFTKTFKNYLKGHLNG